MQAVLLVLLGAAKRRQLLIRLIAVAYIPLVRAHTLAQVSLASND